MDKGKSGQQTEEAKSGKSGSGANHDLTFITNEEGRHLSDRFGVLLGDDSRLCLGACGRGGAAGKGSLMLLHVWKPVAYGLDFTLGQSRTRHSEVSIGTKRLEENAHVTKEWDDKCNKLTGKMKPRCVRPW